MFVRKYDLQYDDALKAVTSWVRAETENYCSKIELFPNTKEGNFQKELYIQRAITAVWRHIHHHATIDASYSDFLAGLSLEAAKIFGTWVEPPQ